MSHCLMIFSYCSSFAPFVHYAQKLDMVRRFICRWSDLPCHTPPHHISNYTHSQEKSKTHHQLIYEKYSIHSSMVEFGSKMNSITVPSTIKGKTKRHSILGCLFDPCQLFTSSISTLPYLYSLKMPPQAQGRTPFSFAITEKLSRIPRNSMSLFGTSFFTSLSQKLSPKYPSFSSR